jgi:hypothetical protein
MANKIERRLLDPVNIPGVIWIAALALGATISFAPLPDRIDQSSVNHPEARPLLVQLLAQRVRQAFTGSNSVDIFNQLADTAADLPLSGEVSVGMTVTVQDPLLKKIKIVRITALDVNTQSEIVGFIAVDPNEPNQDLAYNGYTLSNIVKE